MKKLYERISFLSRTCSKRQYHLALNYMFKVVSENSVIISLILLSVCSEISIKPELRTRSDTCIFNFEQI